MRSAGRIHLRVRLLGVAREEAVLLVLSVQVVAPARGGKQSCHRTQCLPRLWVHPHSRVVAPGLLLVRLAYEVVARDVGLPQQLLSASHHRCHVLHLAHQRGELLPPQLALHHVALLQLVQQRCVLGDFLGFRSHHLLLAVHRKSDVGLDLAGGDPLLRRVRHPQPVHEVHHGRVLLCRLLHRKVRWKHAVTVVHEHGRVLRIRPTVHLACVVQHPQQHLRHVLLQGRTICPAEHRVPVPVKVAGVGVHEAQVVPELRPSARVEEGILQVPAELVAAWRLQLQHLLEHVVLALHRQRPLVDARRCEVVDGSPLVLLWLPHPPERVCDSRLVEQWAFDRPPLHQPAQLRCSLVCVRGVARVIPPRPPVRLRFVVHEDGVASSRHLLQPGYVFLVGVLVPALPPDAHTWCKIAPSIIPVGGLPRRMLQTLLLGEPSWRHSQHEQPVAALPAVDHHVAVALASEAQTLQRNAVPQRRCHGLFVLQLLLV